MKYIIGNWKANKTYQEAQAWIDEFLAFDFTHIQKKAHAIICPPYPFIIPLYEKIKSLPFISVGSQDASLFYQGAYTGEVTAHSLKTIVSYAIIGHSERRKYLHENDDVLFTKVDHLQKEGIEPIYCVRGLEDKIPQVKFVAYEPIHAIGTGLNEPLNNIIEMKKSLSLAPDTLFIYGGSVNEENAREYLSHPDIDGVLPGGSSLDSKRFFQIAKSCI